MHLPFHSSISTAVCSRILSVMGVSGLWTLLEPVGKRVNIKSLAGKTLAIGMCVCVNAGPCTDVFVSHWAHTIRSRHCVASLSGHVQETESQPWALPGTMYSCNPNSALAALQMLLYGCISSLTPCEMMMETSSRMVICWDLCGGSAGSCSTASGRCLCLMAPHLRSSA